MLEIAVPYHFLTYRSFSWSTYHYQLQGYARLLDRSTRKVVWAAECWIGGVNSDESFELNRSEFAANESARFKEVLAHAGGGVFRRADERPGWRQRASWG